MDLLQIKTDAWSASGPAHARMRREWDIYHNSDYAETERVLRDMVPRAKASLNPQIQKGILRLISPFVEQAVRIEVEPDRSDHTDEDIRWAKDLENWNTMMEEARGESEILETAVLHNLVGGMACSKTYFDTRTRIVRSDPVHPLSVAVDAEASRIDLSDAMCVAQCTWHDEHYLKRHYDWEPKEPQRRYDTRLRYNLPTHRLDELWIRRELAEDCVDFDKDKLESTKKQMFRAVLIDDEVIEIKPSPFWWPDFPYSFWRNFTSVHQDRRAADFWGFGYGTLLSPQQKMLDEMSAALIAIARNMPSGQVVTTKGALDPEQQYGIDRQIIELQPGKDIGTDFQHLPPFQISPVFGEMVQYITQIMEEMMPSLSEVFTGEQPSGGASGRAINSLQAAAFTQLSANLRAFNEWRKARVRQTLTLIQQTAKKPISPHLWRGGLDIPDYFPIEARYVGFQLTANDASAMPHSPIAKLQVAQTLASLGYMMTLDEMLKFTGLDRGYGLLPEMFMQMPMVQPGGQQGGTPQSPSMDILTGQDVPMP